MYVGSSSGMEEEFCKEQKIEFKAVATGKLRRYFSIKNIIDWFKLPIGMFQSYKIIKSYNPDVIFSKGGYVAVPVVIAGGILRKKIVIHESDFTPGLATRISSFFAKKICVPTEETKIFLSRIFRRKVEVTGNPVRAEILKGKKSAAEKFLKKKVKSPVLLVMGGSTGAQKLNELIWDSLKKLTKKFTVIHVTGKGKGSGENIKNKKYFEFEYLGKELKHIYAVTDLIICRAGAGTVSEVNALGLPAVYVPLSSGASRGDQWDNAKHVSSTPNIIINEAMTDAKECMEKIELFWKENRSKRSSGKSKIDGAKNIAHVILNV